MLVPGKGRVVCSRLVSWPKLLCDSSSGGDDASRLGSVLIKGEHGYLGVVPVCRALGLYKLLTFLMTLHLLGWSNIV